MSRQRATVFENCSFGRRHCRVGRRLRGFRHFPPFDTGRADFHPLCAALGLLHANGLEIRIEAAAGTVIRVRYVVTELRPLAADFASFSHNYLCYLRTEKNSARVSYSSYGDGGAAY